MKTTNLDAKKSYKVIYADPPWTYPKTGGTTSSRGMAKQFYQTMSLEDIKNLDVKSLADEDCLLFMWCTYPQLPNGLAVIEAWGFEYIGLGFEWIKKTSKGNDFLGMGYWTRANPECCLIAKIGKPKPQSHSIRQLVYAPITKHSEKPAVIRDLIVELAGDVPRIELFARHKTPGWDIWGNELENDVALTDSNKSDIEVDIERQGVDKEKLDAAMDKVIEEYGETLRLLGEE